MKKNLKRNKKLEAFLADIDARDARREPPSWMDKTKPLTERKKLWNDFWDAMVNPVEDDDFNPETFEPMADDEALVDGIADRHLKRAEPSLPLETVGLKPKPFRKGQLIGMYESRQDIYLTLAWAINKLWEEFEEYKRKHP